MKLLERSLSAEIFNSPQEHRRAKWLNGYLLFINASVTLTAVFNLLFANENSRLFGLYIGLLPPVLFLMMLLRRGMVRTVSVAVCLLHHVSAFSYIIFLAGGIRSPAIIYLQLGIPLATLLFERRVAIGITFFVCLGMLLTYMLEANGIIVPKNAIPAGHLDFVMLLVGHIAGVAIFFSASYVVADRAVTEKNELHLAYESMFQHLPIGMYLSSPDNKQIRVNKALALINGYESPDEMHAKFDENAGEWYVKPNRYNEFLQLLNQNGRLMHFDSEVYRPKTKEKMWISESAIIVKRPDGSISHYEGTIQDITERKLAEQELKESKEQYRMIADTAVDGILTFMSHGEISFVNPEACKIFDFEVDDLVGEHVEKLLPELADFENNEELSTVKSKRMIGWRKDGEAFPVEIALGRGRKNSDYFYTAIIRDITDRIKIEKTLQDTTTQMQLITDNVPGWIAYIDKDLIIRFANQYYIRSLGIPRDKIIGKHVTQVIGEEGYNKAKDRISQAMQGEQIAFVDQILLLKENSLRDIIGAYVPNIVDDQVEGIFVFLQDVTEQRKTEKALQEAQRLDSLGVLAGGIAHDFNNLLLAMMGQITLAQLKLDEDNKASKNLQKAEDAANRAASLCRQLLAYSGQGHFEVDQIDLNELITQNQELFNVAISKSVKLTTALQPDLPLMEGDKAQIQQVVMNLIINGAEAIGEEIGKVEVKTSTKQLKGDETNYWRWTAQPLEEGNYVSVMITDNGSGITEENLRKIFDPFFTTKEKGHGLGLSAVVGIIRGHNAGLLVETTPSVGTTFEILFPVSETPEIQETEPAESATFLGHDVNILIIDDDDAIRDVIEDILSTAGYKTKGFSSGETALPYLELSHMKYGLVILDLTLPGMGGVEILKHIREIDASLPVVVSSGYHHTEALSRFDNTRPNHFLQKPYKASLLISTVNQFCRIPERV